MLNQQTPLPPRVFGLRSEILIALMVAQRVMDELGAPLVITSAAEPGAAHSRTSLHYAGAAVDIRSRDLSEQDQARACDLLRARLGAEFDVVHEDSHIHIEFQPKRT